MLGISTLLSIFNCGFELFLLLKRWFEQSTRSRSASVGAVPAGHRHRRDNRRRSPQSNQEREKFAHGGWPRLGSSHAAGSKVAQGLLKVAGRKPVGNAAGDQRAIICDRVRF